jgi:hypothetical protein
MIGRAIAFIYYAIYQLAQNNIMYLFRPIEVTQKEFM